MIILEKQQRFSAKTGKPIDEVWVETSQAICDYSGRRIDLDDHLTRPLYSIKFEYGDSCEADWYYDEVDELIELIGKDKIESDDGYHLRHVIANAEFHFNRDEEDVSIKAMEQIIKSGANSIAEGFRQMRMKTLIKVLKEGKISAEELGLIET